MFPKVVRPLKQAVRAEGGWGRVEGVTGGSSQEVRRGGI